MGTVKDLHEKITNNLFKYADGSIDQWMPLNGATVKLLKDGHEVAHYNVDNNYNGLFVFSNLQPGNYKVVASCPGYRPQGDYTTGSVTSEYVCRMSNQSPTLLEKLQLTRLHQFHRCIQYIL